jgi:cytochrome b pre-mRNA-processing protein 3
MAQELTDLAFHRLDQGLREIGIGDMGVPKRMKTLAKAFYGRAAAYDTALACGDRARLVEALRRNVLDGGKGDADRLASRVEAIERQLAGLDLDAMLERGLNGIDAREAAMGGPR